MTDRIRDVIDPFSRCLAGLVDEGGDHDWRVTGTVVMTMR